jgi:hypothetical protein
VGVDDADAESEFVLGDPDRELEVGVVRDNDRGLTFAVEGVEEQEGGEVDVGALLLGLHDLDGAGAAARSRERHPGDVAQVVAVVDRDFGDCFERSQLDLLPLRGVRVSGRALTVAVK